MKRTDRSLALGLLALLCAPPTMAQNSGSLEDTYAALCATTMAQQGETCVALQKAIAAKGVSASQAMPAQAGQGVQLDRERWGVYADLVGRKMTVGNDTNAVFAMVEYRYVDGKLVERWTWYGNNAYGSTDDLLIEYLPDRGQLRLTNSQGKKWLGTVQPDGAVLFSKGTIVGSSQVGYYPTANGIERRTHFFGKDTVEHIAPFDTRKEAGFAQIAADNRETERREKAEAAETRARMLNAFVSGASQGYAEYQAQRAEQQRSAPAVTYSPPPPATHLQETASTDGSTTGSGRREYTACVFIEGSSHTIHLSEIVALDYPYPFAGASQLLQNFLDDGGFGSKPGGICEHYEDRARAQSWQQDIASRWSDVWAHRDVHVIDTGVVPRLD